MPRRNNLIIENAHFIFRTNFSGKAMGEYDHEGKRYFNVRIEDEELRDKLTEDGWTVKCWTPEDGDPIYFIKVNVRFDNYPPTVYLLSNGVRTQLTEHTVGQLDSLEFKNVDISINPSRYYDRRAKRDAIAAYLESGYFEVDPDPLAEKYANYGIEGMSDEEAPF